MQRKNKNKNDLKQGLNVETNVETNKNSVEISTIKVALSRRSQGLDSPTGYHKKEKHLNRCFSFL
jgi:hypothetical protein